MRGYVGLTDDDWYAQLSAAGASEANFWKPSAAPMKALQRGEPLFFLLKKPRSAICGFGIFVRFQTLPVWLAWETFGTSNGVASRAELVKRIAKYRGRFGATGEIESSQIGCIVLEECTWFPERQWVTRPADWHDNIVSGKGYALEQGEGKRLWIDCLQRAAVAAGAIPLVASVAEAARFGSPVLVQPRLGQGAFRLEVIDAYEKACAVTTEHSLPVLEAAHIRPYAEQGPHDVTNGVLLRTDLHRLLDRGYVTITDDHRFEVSRRLREDYENGKAYYAMQGQALHLPTDRSLAPAQEHLRWHHEHVFLG